MQNNKLIPDEKKRNFKDSNDICFGANTTIFVSTKQNIQMKYTKMYFYDNIFIYIFELSFLIRFAKSLKTFPVCRFQMQFSFIAFTQNDSILVKNNRFRSFTNAIRRRR